MQLSLHADYSLRVLLYLGANPGRVVSTQEISRAYNISKHHLVRVVQTLAAREYVRVSTGRSGGVSLARNPKQIFLGDVIRQTEPNLALVECFDVTTNTCPITPACGLKHLLKDALTAFLETLNRHNLADLLAQGRQRKLSALFFNITDTPPLPPRVARGANAT